MKCHFHSIKNNVSEDLPSFLGQCRKLLLTMLVCYYNFPITSKIFFNFNGYKLPSLTLLNPEEEEEERSSETYVFIRMKITDFKFKILIVLNMFHLQPTAILLEQNWLFYLKFVLFFILGCLSQQFSIDSKAAYRRSTWSPTLSSTSWSSVGWLVIDISCLRHQPTTRFTTRLATKLIVCGPLNT